MPRLSKIHMRKYGIIKHLRHSLETFNIFNLNLPFMDGDTLPYNPCTLMMHPTMNGWSWETRTIATAIRMVALLQS